MKDEIFDSCTRRAGDLAGVFEYDAETGYFYLCHAKGDDVVQILNFVSVTSTVPDFSAKDVVIRWDGAETHVGLFIKGVLWAVFDTERNAKYGGGYGPYRAPGIPMNLISRFVVQ